MFQPFLRQALPKATDRLQLGISGLTVSAICLGIVESPETIGAAYDAGVNFFFLTADLHWPLYEPSRQGLADLLSRSPSVRDEVVVGVVSYLDQPLFQALQFHEVVDAVPGLERVDLLIAGAVPDESNFFARFNSIHSARAAGHVGARAIGASFHDRRSALISLNYNCLDINYIRYNTAHPGATQEIFPYLRQDRAALIYNFKSLMSPVTSERFQQLGFNDDHWFPKPTDYYRFVLSNPHIDGILCSPSSPEQLGELLAALDEKPLTPDEQQYMAWLSSLTNPRYF